MEGYDEAVNQCSGVLPGDLIVEILQRLPVRSLLRFESTSKPWRLVIRNSKFIEKHYIHHKKDKKKKMEFNYLHLYNRIAAGCRNNNQRFALCYCSPAISVSTVSTGISLISKREDGNVITSAVAHSPLKFDMQSVSIVGSSNGLVCIRFSHLTLTRNVDFICWDRRFAIWNPATRKLKHLPRPQHALVVGSLCNIIVGFSYIPSKSTYKLVQICVFKSHDAANNNVRFGACVQVLNVGENSWRKVVCQGQDEAIHELGWRVEFLESSRVYIHNLPLVANGCLHWLGLEGHRVSLVSFDLDTQVFTQTTLPYPFDYDVKPYHEYENLVRSGRGLAVFDDDLATFVSPKKSNSCYEVWVYEGTSKSWTYRFSFGPLPKDEHPIGFWGNGEIIIKKKSSLTYPILGSKPYLYNPSNNEKKIFPCSEWGCNLAFEPYIESLVEI